MAAERFALLVMLFRTVWAVVLSVTAATAVAPAMAVRPSCSVVPAGMGLLIAAVIFFARPPDVFTVYVVELSVRELGALPAVAVLTRSGAVTGPEMLSDCAAALFAAIATNRASQRTHTIRERTVNRRARTRSSSASNR